MANCKKNRYHKLNNSIFVIIIQNMKKKVLKVGFDLDGVILYNPIRVARPIIAFFKSIFFNHKKPLFFYYPKTKIEKLFWKILHLSSLFPAPGVNEIKKLVKEKKIKAYLITGRYSFLENDFQQWIKKLKLKNFFEGIYFNKNDLQPHLFKEKMIKKLNLDIYIEDNWDIVNYLQKTLANSNSKKTKIFWVYNLLDIRKKYQYKFSSLKTAFKKI